MEKRIINIFVAFLISAGSACAVNVDSLFQEANSDYKAGNFESAIGKYLRIDSAGYQSATLYYNTANAYFRSNKIGEARLFYERALLLDPGDEDIQSNLMFLKELLTDRFDEVPELFIKRWFIGFVNIFNTNGWFIISSALFLLAIISFIFYIFGKKLNIRRLGFYLGLGSIVLSIFSLYISYKQWKHIDEPGAAVVIESSGSVKSSPRQSGKDLFILHEGTKVWVENELDQWTEIRISDGRKGWITEETIEKI